MGFAADAAAKIRLPHPPQCLYQPLSLDGSLISLLAISSDVPVGLQKSNFLFEELANLHKNSATLPQLTAV